MSVRTYAATVNELSCAYCLNGRQWFGVAEREFKAAASKLTTEQTKLQMGRGATMANAVVQYLSSQPDAPTIQVVHWVGRQGTITRIVEGASNAHPADIVVGLSNGAYWGVSAKSTSGTSIPLRNPGMGAIEAAIGLSLQPQIEAVIAKAIVELGCPASADARKTYLREQPDIQAVTRKWGTEVLRHVRNVVYKRMSAWDAIQRLSFVEKTLMSTMVYPEYVHVMGYGDHGSFGASVTNPFKLDLSDITIQPVGNASIEFSVHGTKLAVLRAKFESEPLASTLKWSVE